MAPPRLHLQGPIATGNQIELTAERVHYLRHVLRLEAGAEIKLFNEAAGEWRARVGAFGRHTAELTVEALLRQPISEPGPTLVFAPIRRNRLEWLIEKAVELGVGALVPVLTERTVVKLERIDRLQLIATEAAEQCGRLSVPRLASPLPLPRWLAARSPQLPLLLLDETGGGRSMLELLPDPAHRLEILLGPEGGWAPAELTALLQAPAVRRADLGPLVLRSETAGLAALALCRGAMARAGHMTAR